MSGSYIKSCVKDDIFVATLCGTGTEEWGTDRSEHRFCPALLESLSAVLDDAEAQVLAGRVKAFVLGGEGRFWSNGLDLKWMAAAGEEKSQELQRMMFAVFSKLLVFGVPTIAALNGHTVAGGAMLSLCFDDRVMHRDRGYFFVPGVNIGLVYTTGMTLLMTAKTPVAMHNPLIAHGKRFTSADLHEHRVVSRLVPYADVEREAMDLATSLAPPVIDASRSVTMTAIKKKLYAEVYAALRDTDETMGKRRSKV